MVRMKLEMKRAVRNQFYVIFTLINLLNVLLGYILLVTIDKVQNVTFQDMFESVYTVYTQFGTLLFSAFIIMQFYVDYKEKNIFFYKTLGFSELRYYLTKVGMILLATIIGSAFSSILVCVPYAKLGMLPVVFLKIEGVMIYYTLIISTIGFIFSNFLVAFFSSFFLWIAGIVVSAGSPFMEYFAYYDASTTDYHHLISYLDGKIEITSLLHYIAGNYVYDLIVFLICVMAVLCLRRRWAKNGI